MNNTIRFFMLAVLLSLINNSSFAQGSPYYFMDSIQINNAACFDSTNYKNHKADLMVFHPPTSYMKQRPHWLYERKGYTSKEISLEAIESFPIMIKVALEGEPDNAVPLDVLYVGEYKDSVTVFVPENEKYKVIIVDKTNTFIQYP